MKVTLDKFAKSGIEVQLRTDLATGVEAALVHYVDRIESGETPIAPPRFLRDEAFRDEAASLELAVDADARAVLEREARAHEIPVSQVLAHAVFVYLADFDSISARCA